MEIKMRTSNYEMTSDIAAYIDEKMASVERLISDEAGRCEIDIGRAVGHSQHGDVWKAEIVIIHMGERLVAKAGGESVKAAIDIAKDEMLQQLRKGKDKHSSLARRMGARLKKFARRGDIRSY